MRIELVKGETNVVRFPVERRARPTLELLREIAPDVREVLLIAESFDLATPDVKLRRAADKQMADYILNHVRSEPGTPRRTELDALLAPLVQRAVKACQEADDAAVAASGARERLVKAQTEGGYWMEPLEEQADLLTTQAAGLLIDAYVRTEEAEGASRAIGMARRGEAWTPFDLEAETDALFFGVKKLG